VTGTDHERLALNPAAEAHAPGEPPPAPGEAPFYIPATTPASRPRRTLKHNDTFAVLDSHGDIGAAPGINGSQPLLLGSVVRDDNLGYFIDLTNPDIYVDGRLVLLKDTIHIGRVIYLRDGSLRERIALANHGAEPVTFRRAPAASSSPTRGSTARCAKACWASSRRPPCCAKAWRATWWSSIPARGARCSSRWRAAGACRHRRRPS
jgi:hypothetical protein